MVFLDRHFVMCDGAVFNSFKVEARLVKTGHGKWTRWHREIRYKSRCCRVFKWSRTCNINKYHTRFNEDGGGDRGNTIYLDRHRVTCHKKGFLYNFILQRNSAHDRVRYE